jgi:hypothetical protein
MTAPNLKNPNTITGITSSVNVNTTSITGILTNTANSNKVFKINTIFAANVGVTTITNVSISVLRGGTDVYLAKSISIPAGATQIISTKETYFYLEENVGIRAQASVANSVDVTISYEEIS